MSTTQIIIISILGFLCLFQWGIFTYNSLMDGDSNKMLLSLFSLIGLIIFIIFSYLFIVENNKKVKTCPQYERIELTVYKLKE